MTTETVIEPTTETEGSGNSDRLKLLDAINDKNDVDRAPELADVHDNDTTTPFEAPKIESEEDPEPVAAEPQAEKPAPQLVKLRVNNEDLELTLEEVIARAQKVTAADQYLEEARAAKKAARAEEPDPKPEDVEKFRLEEDLKLIRAIQTGSDDEAVAALRKVRSPVNMDEIGRTVDERLAFSRALEWFNTEYDDLTTDPQLHQIVIQRDEELVAKGDKRPYRERYKAIGDDVRSWRDGVVKRFSAANKPADAALDDKVDAKRSAPKTPVAAAVKAQPERDNEDKDIPPSEIIAGMAKHRGGPQWMR